MASSENHIGRIDFVLRVLLITALGRAFEFLFGRNTASQLSLSSRYFQAVEGVVVFGFLGIYLVSAVGGRLLDTGLPRWFRFPIVLVWLFSSLIPIMWPTIWLIGFSLIALLLLAGGLMPSKPKSETAGSSENVPKEIEDEEVSANKQISSKVRKVRPIDFLRSLLTIACLGLPLIWLDTSSVHGTGMWVARVGFSIIGVIWLTKLLGRLEDVGWLSSSWLGYSVVTIVLLNRIRRRLEGTTGQSSQLYGFSLSDAAHSALGAMPWLKSINGYEMLALFLLIQTPLALVPSKQRSKEAPSHVKFQSKFGKLLAERRRTKKRFLVSPSAFLSRLLVIALFWAPLIYLDASSRDGFGTWLARFGYFILIYAWLMNVQGRFEEAGWTEGWYGGQFCLVVTVASLMPLAVNWVNGYVSLVIFVLIQVPAVFLKRKSAGGPHLTSHT